MASHANALLACAVTAMGTNHALGEGVCGLKHARSGCPQKDIRMAEPPLDERRREEVPHARLLRDALERVS